MALTISKSRIFIEISVNTCIEMRAETMIIGTRMLRKYQSLFDLLIKKVNNIGSVDKAVHTNEDIK